MPIPDPHDYLRAFLGGPVVITTLDNYADVHHTRGVFTSFEARRDVFTDPPFHPKGGYRTGPVEFVLSVETPGAVWAKGYTGRPVLLTLREKDSPVHAWPTLSKVVADEEELFDPRPAVPEFLFRPSLPARSKVTATLVLESEPVTATNVHPDVLEEAFRVLKGDA